jgi:hypothetical protein
VAVGEQPRDEMPPDEAAGASDHNVSHAYRAGRAALFRSSNALAFSAPRVSIPECVGKTAVTVDSDTGLGLVFIGEWTLVRG